MIKVFLSALAILLSVSIYADPAAPYGKTFKIDKKNWDISFNNTVKDEIKILKKEAVKIPRWYSFYCTLSSKSLEKENAGLIIGFIDKKNFCLLNLEDQELTLCRFKDGIKTFSISVPCPESTIKNDKLNLRVVIHHQISIKVFFHDKQVLEYHFYKDIPVGQIGLLGKAKFFNISVSGIAKK